MAALILSIVEKNIVLFQRTILLFSILRSEVVDFILLHGLGEKENFEKCYSMAQIILQMFFGRMRDEIELLLEGFYFAVLEEGLPERCEMVLEGLSPLFSSPNRLSEIYYSYDHALCSRFVCKEFMFYLLKYKSRLLTDILEATFECCGEEDSDACSVFEKKKLLFCGIERFNKDHLDGARFIEEHLVEKTQLVEFIVGTPFLSKEQIGTLLGDGSSKAGEMRRLFFKKMAFEKKTFMEALRIVFEEIKVVGESQRIERILESFAERYAACSGEDADRLFQLSYAALILNTDQYNFRVKKKMTRNVFVSAYAHIANENMLGEMFDDISDREIKMKSEKTMSFAARRRNGEECIWFEGERETGSCTTASGMSCPERKEHMGGLFEMGLAVFEMLLSGLEEGFEAFPFLFLEELFEYICEVLLDRLHRQGREAEIRKLVEVLRKQIDRNGRDERTLLCFRLLFGISNKQGIVYSADCWCFLLEGMSKMQKEKDIITAFVYFSQTEKTSAEFVENTKNFLWGLGRASFELPVQGVFLMRVRPALMSLSAPVLSALGGADVFAALGLLARSKDSIVSQIGFGLVERFVVEIQEMAFFEDLSRTLSEYALFYWKGQEALSLLRKMARDADEKGEFQERGLAEVWNPLLMAFSRVLIETKEREICLEAFFLFRETILKYAGPRLQCSDWEMILQNNIGPIDAKMSVKESPCETVGILFNTILLLKDILLQYHALFCSRRELLRSYMSVLFLLIERVVDTNSQEHVGNAVDALQIFVLHFLESIGGDEWAMIAETIRNLLEKTLPDFEYSRETKEATFRDIKTRINLHLSLLVGIYGILKKKKFNCQMEALLPGLETSNKFARDFNANIELRQRLLSDSFLEEDGRCSLEDIVLVKQEMASLACLMYLRHGRCLAGVRDRNLHCEELKELFKIQAGHLKTFLSWLEGRRAVHGVSSDESIEGKTQAHGSEMKNLRRWASIVSEILDCLADMHHAVFSSADPLLAEAQRFLARFFSDCFDVYFYIATYTQEPRWEAWEKPVYRAASKLLFVLKKHWASLEERSLL
eukprot:GHVN01063277.1.p1 GENE.GHVN01063277.1~~GHVN01063277.1.p1  ORF type:complete len:1197 (-),score=153.94 GHVN01063277.1:472-3642(-)